MQHERTTDTIVTHKRKILAMKFHLSPNSQHTFANWMAHSFFLLCTKTPYFFILFIESMIFQDIFNHTRTKRQIN